MVDYSKWKNIEVSDDEDDTHPNVDTPSLFKWRHEARVQRMQDAEQEKHKLTTQTNSYTEEIESVRKQLKHASTENPDDSALIGRLTKRLSDLESSMSDINRQWEEFNKKERLTPWNVDTISHDGFSKTRINSQQKPDKSADNCTEEELAESYKQFVARHKSEIEEYGMLRRYEESRMFLIEHMYLVDEHTANHLVAWCMDLAMEEKFSLMDHVAHQCVCMSYLMKLAKDLDINPKSCVSSFFSRIQKADEEYLKSFHKDIEDFKARIRKRSSEKLQQAIKEYEEEERKKRMGPGNLDPLEVIETLPEKLKKCFETQDVEMLKTVIGEMDPKEASYHMKRCVDSGLWVPDANVPLTETSGEQADSTKQVENTYEDVTSCTG